MRAVLATALAIAVIASMELRRVVARLPPLPQTLYSTMAWDACRFGPSSCAPVFYPVADGSARLLSCSSAGFCGLHTYTYWTDENCNRLTACAAYKPHRGDHDPR